MKPVNLNQFRKSKARDEKRLQTDANAVRHGMTKAEKDLLKARDVQNKAHLDNHKRDR